MVASTATPCSTPSSWNSSLDSDRQEDVAGVVTLVLQRENTFTPYFPVFLVASRSRGRITTSLTGRLILIIVVVLNSPTPPPLPDIGSAVKSCNLLFYRRQFKNRPRCSLSKTLITPLWQLFNYHSLVYFVSRREITEEIKYKKIYVYFVVVNL